MSIDTIHRNAVSVTGSAFHAGLDAWYALCRTELAGEMTDLELGAFDQIVDTLVVEGGWPRPYAIAVWYVLRREHPTPHAALRDEWPAFRGEISQLIGLTAKHCPAALG